MIAILKKIDVTKLLDYYKNIEELIQWTEYGHKGKQAGLQYKENEDCWNSAVGKHVDNDLKYNNLNPFFKDTEFEKIINEFELTRSRFMWIYPYSCYSMHSDQTPRLHIPLITNPDCYIIFKPSSKILHLEVGNIYKTETRIPHTAINCSEFPRLHFVGVLEK
jgi:hypothetical protein